MSVKLAVLQPEGNIWVFVTVTEADNTGTGQAMLDVGSAAFTECHSGPPFIDIECLPWKKLISIVSTTCKIGEFVTLGYTECDDCPVRTIYGEIIELNFDRIKIRCVNPTTDEESMENDDAVMKDTTVFHASFDANATFYFHAAAPHWSLPKLHVE